MGTGQISPWPERRSARASRRRNHMCAGFGDRCLTRLAIVEAVARTPRRPADCTRTRAPYGRPAPPLKDRSRACAGRDDLPSRRLRATGVGMAARASKRRPEGVTVRHGRGCPAREGRCTCRPTYQAQGSTRPATGGRSARASARFLLPVWFGPRGWDDEADRRRQDCGRLDRNQLLRELQTQAETLA